MTNPNTERQRRMVAARKKLGLVAILVWSAPKHRARIRAYVAKLNRKPKETT